MLEREAALVPFRPPGGSGQEVGGAGMGIPGSPGSAKDTRLNVGSHDVTRDIEVDADELALPTGKHSSQWGPQPCPSTHAAGKEGERSQGAFGGAPTNQHGPPR